MSTLEQLDPAIALPLTETYEPVRQPVGFKTAQGSVYSYDGEGKTSRFKTAIGEQLEHQDITVFTPLTLEQEQDYLAATQLDGLSEVEVVERQPDDTGKVIDDLSEVQFPDRLYLTIVQNGKIVQNVPATLQPEVGANVFDMRHFEEDSKTMSERHLGNKVTEILYE